MKPLYVTSDLHISALRSAGTTPQTAWQLRQDLLKGLEDILNRCDSDLAINGDFADDYKMVPADMLAAYYLFANWFEKGHRVYALPGNHCLSKSSLDLSSFEMLFRFLQAQYPDQVELMMEPGALRDGIYAVPHVPNQSLLDLELERVPKGTRYLLLHANVNNAFAQHADHSLDVSEAQLKSLDVEHAIFGHEHVGRELLGGKVVVVGNPFPSSISDCLNNSTKRMLKITDDGHEFIETWKAEGDYVEMHWQELQETSARFVRTVGTATAAEADQVISSIAAFRKSSKALVVGNAVRIAGVNDQAELELSHEEVVAFDVLQALLKILDPDEGTKIQDLLEHKDD